MNKKKSKYLKKFKFTHDTNYHIYYDVETSPVYFIYEKKLVEDSTIITMEQYRIYQIENIKKKEIIYKIGSYQTTKMITIIDEDDNKNIFIVKDKYCTIDPKKYEIIEDDEIVYKIDDAYLTFVKSTKELIDKYWELIDMYIAQVEGDIRIFAHNHQFDIKQVGFFGNKEIIIDDSKTGGVCLSKPFFISTIYKDKKIRWEDSMNFFNSSLKKLGKDIGLEKLDFEFEFNSKELIIDEDCIKYGLRDSEIIKKAIEDFRFEINNNELGRLMTSIAGTAMSIFRCSFNPANIYLNEEKDIIDYEIKCKHGGRTEAFKIGVYDDVYYYDVNSLYPYCMENRLPHEFIRTMPSRPEFNDGYLDDIQIKFVMDSNLKYGIYLIDIETDESNIPKFFENRLCFVKGKHENIILHEAEFKYFYNSDKYKVKVKKIFIYKSSRILKKYVDYFKKMKIDNDDNPTKRQLAKNMLNNLFGKFGQFDRESIIEMFDDEIIVGKELRIENDKTYKIDCFGTFGLKTFENKNVKSENAFPAIAGAITSYARVELLKAIDLLGKENIIYCDTDSIMSLKPLPNYMIHDSEFGKWKLENIKKIKTFEKNNNFKCKDNLVSVLVKGLKNYIIYKKVNGINYCIELKSKGIKKTSEEIEDNIYLQKRFWTIKTSNVKHETLFTLNNTVIMDEIKQNTNKITKGKINSFDKNEILIHFKDGNKKIKFVNADVEAFTEVDLLEHTPF